MHYSLCKIAIYSLTVVGILQYPNLVAQDLSICENTSMEQLRRFRSSMTYPREASCETRSYDRKLGCIISCKLTSDSFDNYVYGIMPGSEKVNVYLHEEPFDVSMVDERLARQRRAEDFVTGRKGNDYTSRIRRKVPTFDSPVVLQSQCSWILGRWVSVPEEVPKTFYADGHIIGTDRSDKREISTSWSCRANGTAIEGSREDFVEFTPVSVVLKLLDSKGSIYYMRRP